MTTNEKLAADIASVTDIAITETQIKWALTAAERAGYELRKVGTPITLDDMTKAWDGAEVLSAGSELQKGDTHITRIAGNTYTVGYVAGDVTLHRSEPDMRVLSRRPAPALPAEPGVRFRAREVNSKGKGRVFVTLSTGDIWTDDGIALRDVFERRYTVIEVIG